MIIQRLILDGGYPDGVWSCPGCGAHLEEGVLAHPDNCTEIGVVAARGAPPHDYVPPGSARTAPQGRYAPPEVRDAAFAAVLDGVPLGTYDWRIIGWLTGLDDPTCRTIASVMWRCRIAGPPGRASSTHFPPGSGMDDQAAEDNGITG